MTPGAAACACDAGGEVLKKPLLEPEQERQAAGGGAMERDPIKMAAERAAKFIFRGLLILLWVYLFNSMKTYAVNYTGGDTTFSMFAAIVIAIPIAEIFCILGKALVEPSPPVQSSSMPCRNCVCTCVPAANGTVRNKEEVDALFSDLENGILAMTGTTDAEKVSLHTDTVRIAKCILRGFMVLLWVHLVDLFRRYVATHGVEELFFTISPLGILAACVSFLFCFLMESFGESIELHMELPYN